MAEFIIAKGVLRQVAKANFNIAKAIGIHSGRIFAFRAQRSEVEEPDATSYLGTPMFDPIRIKGGSYFELDDIDKENPVPYPDAEGADGNGLIMPAVLIEVTQTKNIITTAIQGRNGTVKEFISDGDFSVTLTGVIVGRNEGGEVKDIGNVYPSDDVNKLITICKVPDSIEIISDFLGLFSDPKIENPRFVITDYNIPQREASRDMQPFQISLLSDSSINLDELAI